MAQEPRVFAVDDDPLVLRAIERTLRWHNIPVEGFSSPATFLQRLPYDGVACLLLDLQMPGMTGLDVQTTISREGMAMPVVFLSARGDVPSTARAMGEGAVDFLVKPVEEDQLLEALERARVKAIALRHRRQLERATQEKLARLTVREREVCELVATGLLNKQIAKELGMSERTVKVHRGRVTHKLGVDSVAGLVRLLSSRPTSRPS